MRREARRGVAIPWAERYEEARSLARPTVNVEEHGKVAAAGYPLDGLWHVHWNGEGGVSVQTEQRSHCSALAACTHPP